MAAILAYNNPGAKPKKTPAAIRKNDDPGTAHAEAII